MKTPPFLFAAALLFWGWQTGYLVFAVPMAAVLEATRLVRRRWHLSPKDFYRVADLCALIFMAMFAVRYLADTESMGRWIPFGIFPLVLAQALSTVEGVDLGAIFYTERQKEKKRGGRERKTADVTWPGLVLVLVGASAANVRSPAFFLAVFVLSGWGLWGFRPPNRSAVIWALAFVLAGAAGYAGQAGLRRLHLAIDEAALQWYMANRAPQRNPLRNVTAIGEVGTLKRSNRILMRVAAKGGLPDPPLLREASYSIYRSGRWMASEAGFTPVAAGKDEGEWILSDAPEKTRELAISATFADGDGFLSLPMEAVAIENLPADRVEKNRYGAMRVLQAPELVQCRVRYGNVPSGDAPPGREDLEIPEQEAPAVERAAAGLFSDRLPPEQAISRIRAYFKKNFSYSLTQERRRWGVLPLEQFLFETRAGHCEFFATATVLLLRAAGVPARYAVGYQVAEFSRLEGRFVVRSRHAHAWAQAYVGGRWRIVDTTPPQWFQIEEDAASTLLPVFDLFRWLGFQVDRWRWGGKSEGVETFLLWVLAPLVLVLLWRIVFQKRTSTTRETARSKQEAAALDPAASRLAGIDACLAAEGFERRVWETELQRLERLAEAGADPLAVSGLMEILRLHYRDRFHPDGLESDDKGRLEAKIFGWIERYSEKENLFAAREAKIP
ncbi:MAG: transglutaminase-like domain-containing protein [Desulfobacterales bacterium]|jgi:hypothetical protein